MVSLWFPSYGYPISGDERGLQRFRGYEWHQHLLPKTQKRASVKKINKRGKK